MNWGPRIPLLITFPCRVCRVVVAPLSANHAPFVVSDDPNGSSFRVRDVAIPGGLTDGRLNQNPTFAVCWIV